jgi:hypothetical protein
MHNMKVMAKKVREINNGLQVKVKEMREAIYKVRGKGIEERSLVVSPLRGASSDIIDIRLVNNGGLPGH